jgi:hypothetical protein
MYVRGTAATGSGVSSGAALRLFVIRAPGEHYDEGRAGFLPLSAADG